MTPGARVSSCVKLVVGRDEALSRLRARFEKMLGGERQVVFVAGEAGIGKTALVDTFARNLASERGIPVGRGQCLEQYGTGEAYLPVLEAIGRLCREAGAGCHRAALSRADVAAANALSAERRRPRGAGPRGSECCGR